MLITTIHVFQSQAMGKRHSLYCRALASKAVFTLTCLPSLLREYVKVVEGRGYKESVLQTHKPLLLHL